MRKVVGLMLALVMALSFVACDPAVDEGLKANGTVMLGHELLDCAGDDYHRIYKIATEKEVDVAQAESIYKGYVRNASTEMEYTAEFFLKGAKEPYCVIKYSYGEYSVVVGGICVKTEGTCVPLITHTPRPTLVPSPTTAPTSPSAPIPSTPAPQRAAVLCEKGGVKITFAGVKKGTFDTIQLLIENNSGAKLTFRCEDFSLNGYMMRGSLYEEITSGKKAYADIILLDKELEALQGASWEACEFRVEGYNSEYDTVFDSGILKLNF